MKLVGGLIVVCLIAVLFFTLQHGDRSVGSFVIIPEPSLSDIRTEGWSVDEEAMLDHYQRLFDKMPAEQVVHTLEENNIQFKFISDTEIQFGVSKGFLPVMASYRCLVRVSFADGFFDKAEDISACGVVA